MSLIPRIQLRFSSYFLKFAQKRLLSLTLSQVNYSILVRQSSVLLLRKFLRVFKSGNSCDINNYPLIYISISISNCKSVEFESVKRIWVSEENLGHCREFSVTLGLVQMTQQEAEKEWISGTYLVCLTQQSVYLQKPAGTESSPTYAHPQKNASPNTERERCKC